MVLFGGGLFLLAPASASADSIVAVVTYFDNTAEDKSLDPLRKGLADMLMTDLGGSTEVRLVERARLEDLLKEIKLGDGPFLDPSTAQKMGRGLSADLIVTGAFLSMDPTMRIDARVVMVETGEVLFSTKVEGSSSEFFALEARLATALLEGIGVTVTPMLRVKIARSPTKNLDAMVSYSRGLDASDRGEAEEAKGAFSKALEADPNFSAAQARLDALEKRISEVEARVADQSEELAAISAGNAGSLAELLRKAEGGDRGAQFDVGRIYYSGIRGAARDIDEAVDWLKLSADQGHPGASYYLGHLAWKNEGTVAKWLKKSVADGDPCRAYFKLGVLAEARGDFDEALRWFDAAVEGGRATRGFPTSLTSDFVLQCGITDGCVEVPTAPIQGGSLNAQAKLQARGLELLAVRRNPLGNAGFQRGDLIVAINGTELGGLHANDVMSLISGPPGSQLHIVRSFLRNGQWSEETLDLRLAAQISAWQRCDPYVFGSLKASSQILLKEEYAQKNPELAMQRLFDIYEDPHAFFPLMLNDFDDRRFQRSLPSFLSEETAAGDAATTIASVLYSGTDSREAAEGALTWFGRAMDAGAKSQWLTGKKERLEKMLAACPQATQSYAQIWAVQQDISASEFCEKHWRQTQWAAGGSSQSRGCACATQPVQALPGRGTWLILVLAVLIARRPRPRPAPALPLPC